MQVHGPAQSPFIASLAPSLRAPAPEAGRTAAPAPAESRPAPAESRPSPAESSLWDLLTPEERDFFSRAAELGPLSYRPGGANPIGVPLPTGQRIDVRG